MLLSEGIYIGSLPLRNRIVMPPMATRSSDHGAPTVELIRYYAARAEWTGLIIVEHEYVSAEGMANKGQLSMADRDLLPAYRSLTEAIHEKGGAVFAQISHAGALASDTGLPSIGPDETPVRDSQQPVRMTQEDIRKVTDAFTRAALLAKEAGFDGVEVHAAHGYLLNQFYSPAVNHRTDDYTGSSIEGRTRLHTEIIRGIKAAAGSSYPVAIRFGACDYMENGSSPEDIPEAVQRFEAAGADMIDISGGLNGFMIKGHSEPGWFADLSRRAKGAVSVPVMLTGGIITPEDVEKLLQSGVADLIGVGRAMLKDAEWAKKALQLPLRVQE